MMAKGKGKGHNGRDRGRGRWYRLSFVRQISNHILSKQGRKLTLTSDHNREVSGAGGLKPAPEAKANDGRLPERPKHRQAAQGDCTSTHPEKPWLRCCFALGHGGRRHYRRQGSHKIYWPNVPGSYVKPESPFDMRKRLPKPTFPPPSGDDFVGLHVTGLDDLIRTEEGENPVAGGVVATLGGPPCDEAQAEHEEVE